MTARSCWLRLAPACGWFVMVPLLLAEHLGVENIASSYGLVRLAQCTTNLSGPLVAGPLFQKTGKVAASFYFMGARVSLYTQNRI